MMPTEIANASSPPSPRWLTLSQAARMLGVHPTTLRRWTDEGELPCVRTPGGHRRFLQEDLHAFLRDQVTAGGDELPRALRRSLIQETRHEIEAEHIAETSWHAAFTEAERAERRRTGRRLLGLAIQYTSRTTGRDAILQEAHTIGRAYGRDAAQRGLSLVEVAQAYTFFREALINAAEPSPLHRGAVDAEDVRLRRNLRRFLNQVFFAAMEGFEERLQVRLPEQGG